MSDNQRKKVILFTAALGYGGSEGAFMRLAEFLRPKFDVKIVLMSQDYSSQHYRLVRSSSDIPRVVISSSRSFNGGIFGKVRRWLDMLRQIRQLKASSDVAISFLSGPNLLNALSRTRCTTIVSERGSKVFHQGIGWPSKFIWTRFLDPITYGLSDLVVPASEGYASEVRSIAYARSRGKIRSIEGGVCVRGIQASSVAAGDADIVRYCERPTLVFCGRLDRGKGLDLIIPAFGKVRRKLPRAQLLVIGDGPMLEEIKRICAREGLSYSTSGKDASDSSVFLAGYRANPARHFKYCTALVFPSLHEGLPNVLIEALASGARVLASDCPWGTRAILGCPPDSAAEYGTAEPVELRFGLLLPLPSTDSGLIHWERSMFRALAEPTARLNSETSISAVSRFDMGVVGPQWLDAIQEATLRRISRVSGPARMLKRTGHK